MSLSIWQLTTHHLLLQRKHITGSIPARWALESYVVYHIHIFMYILLFLPYSIDQKHVKGLAHAEAVEGIAKETEHLEAGIMGLS